MCPITTQAKGYPFEAALPASCGAEGVALADPVRSVDWRARRAVRAAAAPPEVVEKVLALLAPLLGD